MEYLFNPDNWEWVWTGNNFRFLLEGFLINLEIAAIGIVFSLIFGLLLALMRISSSRLISVPAGIWVDLWRNLPLILIILYLGARRPELVAAGVGGQHPGLVPGGAPGRARPRRHPRARPLQLGRPLRDHALGDPLARPRPARGGGVARPHLPPADAVRDPAPGPAPDGAGHGLAADHAEQGHDAGHDPRDHRGARPRQQPELRRRSSAGCRRRSFRST